MPIPEEIRARREKRGLTQQQAADAAGMLQHVWSRLESGGRPNPQIDTLRRVASVLRCKVEDLIQ